MDGLALVCAVLLAAVFAVSGVAKLLDRRGTREAVQALGVPLAGPVAVLLPLVELVLAATLVPPATGRRAALAGLLLLLAFTVVVVANLLAGRRPQCGCFGGLGSSDVSWRTVGRNGLLLLAAGLATGARTGSLLPAVPLAVAGAALLVGGEQLLSRRATARVEGEQLRALDAPLSALHRERAPAFSVPDVEGKTVTLTDLLARGRPLLLVFLNPGCSSCRRLVPSVVRWHEDYADRLTTVAVSGHLLRDTDGLGGTAALRVLSPGDDSLVDAFGVRGSPAAVLVATDGRLATPVAYGVGGVRRLFEVALTGVERRTSTTTADALDLDSRPGPRATVTAREVDGSTVLVDEATGASLSLDLLGAVVWQSLDGVASLREIAADIAEVFSADPDVVGRDVLRTVQACGAAGLLDGIAAGRPAPPVLTASKEPA